MSKNYKYPLKVWLSTAFAGALLSILLTLISPKFSFYGFGSLDYQKDNILPMLSFHLFGLVFTLAITVPCWLIFWYIYSRWFTSSGISDRLRLRLVVLSQALAWGLFIVVFLMVGMALHLWGMYLIVGVPYAIVAALCAWIYFPKQFSIQKTNEVYKINFKHHLQNGYLILFTIIVLLIFTIVMAQNTTDDPRIFIWISSALFAVFGIPAIVIHINYLITNQKDVLFVDLNTWEFEMMRNGKKTSFALEDIKYVEKYMSFNFAANRSPFLAWDPYNHTIFFLNDGTKLVVTSLLVPNINLPLSEEKILLKRNLFRLVS